MVCAQHDVVDCVLCTEAQLFMGVASADLVRGSVACCCPNHIPYARTTLSAQKCLARLSAARHWYKRHSFDSESVFGHFAQIFEQHVQSKSRDNSQDVVASCVHSSVNAPDRRVRSVIDAAGLHGPLGGAVDSSQMS